jgi:glycosyltransferase involved in cell wall biosynthesis
VARRLLLVGQAGAPSGFARVLDSLAEHLPAEWETHVLATNVDAAGVPARATLHRNPEPRDLRGARELPRVLARVRPEVVLVHDEPRGCAEHRDVFAPPRAFRVVHYAAIDRFDCLTRARVEALLGLDSLVVFAPYGQRVLQVAWRRWGSARPATSVIPHGVDARVFHPLAGDPASSDLGPARGLARARLFPDRPELDEGAFLVLNANRNQPSKRIDVTLEGFALFAHGKPANVMLYLHMGTRPRGPGEVALVEKLGLRERVLGVAAGDHPAWPRERLNLLYNACDVGLNTSEGEGFGLVAFEHAAAGAAQIVPRHSACAELWEGAAWLVDPVRRTQLEGCRTAGRTLAPQAVADALETLYADRQRRRALSAAAYRHATQPRFQWAHIAQQWARHFDDLVAGRAAP